MLKDRVSAEVGGNCCKILKLLATEPNLSQRAVSQKVGVSLGKTNYVLTELAEKGIIKIKRLKNAPRKIPYAYILTPRGLEQKAKITARFLKHKIAEYEAIKRQIKEIAKEIEKDETIDLSGDSTLKQLAQIQ